LAGTRRRPYNVIFAQDPLLAPAVSGMQAGSICFLTVLREVNPLAKPNFQFQKRQKELEKKRKQEEKRQRKLEKTPERPAMNPDEPLPPPGEVPPA